MKQQTRGRHRAPSHRKAPQERRRWTGQDTFAAVMIVAFLALAAWLFVAQVGNAVTP